MSRKVLSLGAVFVVALMALASSARADDYKADPVHSFVVFDVHHLGAGYVYGTFAGPTGAVTFSTDDLTQTSFDLSVDVDSLDTRNERRDNDLKGPDFFDVKQFPTMTFKSTSVTKTGDTTMSVTGDLTLKGVTKSITVPMEYTGTGQMMGQTRAGFRADFTVNRSDFGMVKDAPPMIANEIHVIVAIEAVKQ
jgi:polyisoprenoid-binding protein YceI